MAVAIRDYQPTDEEQVIALSLRAWAPVFASMAHGLGLTLTDLATDWLRETGMKAAMIGTGGDEGHAPARRTYEKANDTLFPSAQYFKAL